MQKHAMVSLLAVGMGIGMIPLRGEFASAQDAGSQSAPSAIFSDSPLAKARTIQVTIKREYARGKSEKVQETLHVQAVRPNKVHIEATFASEPSQTDVYISNGSKQYDYQAARKRYQIADEGSDELSSTTRIVSKVDTLLLNPQIPADKGAVRTYATETLDGSAMVVRTDVRSSPATKSQPETDLIDKVWVDVATKLPYRTARLQRQDGKVEELVHAYYSEWELDKAIAEKQFVWNAPAGATELVLPKLLKPGTPAPDFALADPSGKIYRLSDCRGKVVVLDFWATWCGPCQQSMPHLEKVYKQVQGKDVIVLGVCVLDEKKSYDAWVKAHKGIYTFPTVFDAAGRGAGSLATGAYGISGIPAQYVIDKEGIVAGAWIGFDEGDNHLETALKNQGLQLK